MKPPLSPRLLACCDLVAPGDRVADVGCDHGYLGIYLIQKGLAASVIASDLREGPLSAARRNAEKFGVGSKIRFFLTDGLRGLPRDFDTLVCAGMGADVMISILGAAPWLKASQYRLILQCQSKTPTLRQWLSREGWTISREMVLRDGRFLYTVMEAVFRPGPPLSLAETYFPRVLLDHPGKELREYYNRVLTGLRLSLRGNPDPALKQVLFDLENDPNLKILQQGGYPMTTVSDVLSYLNTVAPPYMKESWDNVGLNCGRLSRPVTKILVALDPFAAVCREAHEIGADLLVTHHALIWKPGFVTDETEWGRNALYLIENGIAHINAHTNLDLAPGGVNDVLAKTLGLEDTGVLSPVGTDPSGAPYGLIRTGTKPETSLDAFLSRVREALGCPGLRYVNSGKSVHFVAVGGGSCGSELRAVAAAGCDTFVTSDLRYNQFWDAQDLGLNFIDAGHFYTENPVCAVLAEKLRAAFPEITVELSKIHADCMKFF